MPRGTHQQTAGPVPPSANQRGQAGHGPGGVAAAAHALHAIVQADGGGLPIDKALAIVACQALDLFHRYAANNGGALGVPLQRALFQCRPAQSVLFNVGVVQPVVGDQLMHHRQGQRCVCARQQGNVFVAFFGSFAFAWVNANQLGTVTLGLLCIAPKVQVAADRVAAPDDDEFGLCKKLHPHADLAAQRLRHALTTG